MSVLGRPRSFALSFHDGCKQLGWGGAPPLIWLKYLSLITLIKQLSTPMT